MINPYNFEGAIEVIKKEQECVLRASNTGRCDRHCERCDLLMDSQDIVDAYSIAIGAIEYMKSLRNNGKLTVTVTSK